ncbi:MAG: winged helix-turn-helix transcriptional regulator [Candidatus Micrarchaeota archaeon]|nr:winged helix-turn-helix transcriptional regulator [Candidatus Micrarchaeota archaeon]
MPKSEKIVIKTVSRPSDENAQSLTNWFFESFDLSGKGDTPERKMFSTIVNNSLKGVGTTSKELSRGLKLPLSTVIYNLNKFIDSGLVVRKGREYYLRASDFESTIQEIQAEMITEFNRMMQFASKLDELFEREIYGTGRGQITTEKREKGNKAAKQ